MASSYHQLGMVAQLRGDLAAAEGWYQKSLAIKEALGNPAASEIWKTYGVLAEIAEAEGRAEEARAYRQQQRESFAAAPASQEKLRQHAALIVAVARAVADSSRRPPLEAHLEGMIGHGWGQLVAVVRRLLDGERDEDMLCAGLDHEDSLVVATVLRALADPAAVLAELEALDPRVESKTRRVPAHPEADEASSPNGGQPMTGKLAMYKAYLEEGFHPTQEGELLFFKEEGRSYVLFANEDDPGFFQLVYPGFWSIESDDERARAYQAANHATAVNNHFKWHLFNRDKWHSLG